MFFITLIIIIYLEIGALNLNFRIAFKNVGGYLASLTNGALVNPKPHSTLTSAIFQIDNTVLP